MIYLLDTDICIYIIKKHPQQILAKFKTLPIGDVGISAITLAELSFGVEKSQHKEKNYEALNEFILPLEIVPFDEGAVFHYGEIRARLEKKGTPIGALDLLIAAQAQSMGATLVTNNLKEYKRVIGLRVENWLPI